MTYSKMILYLLNSTIFSDKIQSKSKDLYKNLNNFNEIKFLINSENIPKKSNKKIKGLFKKLNNFKEINLLINRYIFKNNYSKTIF